MSAPLKPLPDGRFWYDVPPKEAQALYFDGIPDGCGPLTDFDPNETCKWPWEPEQLVGSPLGQYHCPYCGAMVMAGMRHLDYRDLDGPEPLAV